MPFRLWHFAMKVGGPVLFAGVVTSFFLPRPLGNVVLAAAFAILLILGIAGAVMGSLLARGKLRMRCPFCSQGGETWFTAGGAMRMKCPSCGTVRASGRLGLKLICEPEKKVGLVAEAEAALEETPPEDRPAGIPLFPGGFRYFRRWRTLQWYVLMMVPLLTSFVLAWLRHERGMGIAILILGATVSAAVFVTLCSGRTSTNGGTFFRKREPIRYWADVALWVAVFVWLSLAGWIVAWRG